MAWPSGPPGAIRRSSTSAAGTCAARLSGGLSHARSSRIPPPPRAPCRLPAVGGPGRPGRGAQQGRRLPAHRRVSGTRPGLAHRRRGRRRRRPAQQRLRRLGSGWALFVEARRDPARPIPTAPFPIRSRPWSTPSARPPSQEAGEHFESRYFLTLTLSAARRGRAADRGPVRRGPGRSTASIGATELAGFIDRTDRVLALLEGLMPEAGWLDDAETLSFLHGAISTAASASRSRDADASRRLLATQPLTGGLEPRLGAAHLRVLTLSASHRHGPGPARRAQSPGLRLSLDDPGPVPRQDRRGRPAGKIRRQWFAKRKSIDGPILQGGDDPRALALVDNPTRPTRPPTPTWPAGPGRRRGGLCLCHRQRGGLGRGSARVADAKLALAEKVIQGRDFTVIRETSTRWRPGWDVCRAMSTPMSASRRSRP
jgi:hypothetical protein